MNDDLMIRLDEYDPNWVGNFATLHDAAVHYGLEHLLDIPADEDSYEPLDFNQ